MGKSFSLWYRSTITGISKNTHSWMVQLSPSPTHYLEIYFEFPPPPLCVLLEEKTKHRRKEWIIRFTETFSLFESPCIYIRWWRHIRLCFWINKVCFISILISNESQQWRNSERRRRRTRLRSTGGVTVREIIDSVMYYTSVRCNQ